MQNFLLYGYRFAVFKSFVIIRAAYFLLLIYKMENTHQHAQPTLKLLDGQKTDFGMIWNNFLATLMPAFDLFKKDPVNFILIFAIPVIVGGLLSELVLPMLLGGLLYGGLVGMLISIVVFIFCSIILSIIAYLALVKAVIEKGKGNKIDLGKIFGVAVKEVVPSIMLSIKVLLAIFGGLKKFINSFLALIYFMESDKPNVEAALKASQDNCEGKTITLVWNYILIALATGIVSGVITNIWVSVTWRSSYQIASMGSFIANGVVTSFAVLFHYVLKTQIEKLHGAAAHAAPHSAAPTEHHKS